MNNPKFNNHIDIYPENKTTTDDPKWANYLDRLEFDNDGTSTHDYNIIFI